MSKHEEAARALAEALNAWEEQTGCAMSCDGNSYLMVSTTNECGAMSWVDAVKLTDDGWKAESD